MYAPRTVVRRTISPEGGGEREMPVYSLQLPDNRDAATSSAVWRQHAVTTPKPFFDQILQATTEAVELMTNIQSQRIELAQESVEVSGLLELKGQPQRLFVMGLSNNCAIRLTASVLGDCPVEVDEELVSDCVGELCNIIVGRLREHVEPDEAFEMSIPIVMFSDQPRIHWQAQAEIHEAHFCTEAGGYTIRLLSRA